MSPQSYWDCPLCTTGDPCPSHVLDYSRDKNTCFCDRYADWESLGGYIDEGDSLRCTECKQQVAHGWVWVGPEDMTDADLRRIGSIRRGDFFRRTAVDLANADHMHHRARYGDDWFGRGWGDYTRRAEIDAALSEYGDTAPDEWPEWMQTPTCEHEFNVSLSVALHQKHGGKAAPIYDDWNRLRGWNGVTLKGDA